MGFEVGSYIDHPSIDKNDIAVEKVLHNTLRFKDSVGGGIIIWELIEAMILVKQKHAWIKIWGFQFFSFRKGGNNSPFNIELALKEGDDWRKKTKIIAQKH